MSENTNMNANAREEYLAKYDRGTHWIGRISTAVCIVLFLGAPFVIGLYIGAMPNLSAIAKGYLSVGLVWTVSSVVEFLVYTPMLGAGGGYLAFITGNLINMIPMIIGPEIGSLLINAQDVSPIIYIVSGIVAALAYLPVAKLAKMKKTASEKDSVK